MFFRFVLAIQRASKEHIVRCFTKISVNTEDMSWYLVVKCFLSLGELNYTFFKVARLDFLGLIPPKFEH